MRTFLLAFLLAGAAALMAPPAAAQSTRDRVEVLERAVADLQARAPAAADSAVKINQLEQQIQSLTGQIEQLSHELDRANARIEAMTAALAGETGGETIAGAPPALGGPTRLGGDDPIADTIARSGAPAPSGDESEVALPIDPNAAFEYASGFLMRGDYDRAREAFEMYLEVFPNHPRTSDARFRLGEIYLATGANAEAAESFMSHIRSYPNDPRAAEAYLKLGTAFSRMQQTGEACTVFKTMRSKYPNAAPPVRQRADVEMQRIDCR